METIVDFGTLKNKIDCLYKHPKPTFVRYIINNLKYIVVSLIEIYRLFLIHNIIE